VLHSVLIVDDTEFMRFLMREIMSDLAIGMIAEAGCLEEAMDLAEVLQPNLAIIDFTDPGLDAPKITRALQSRHHDLPVVAITHLDDDAQTRSAIASGAVACVVKPFDSEAVRTVLQDLIETVPMS